MNKSEKQIAQAAQRFAERWQGKGYEKGESQTFWLELLTEVFGVKEPSTFITFEEQVKLDATNFIDGHIPSTRVLIEQKSLGKDLRQPIKQSDGTYLTPFQQAKRYVTNLPVSMHPRWIVTCNFSTFLVYDMENPTGDPFEIRLADLGKEYYRLRFLVETDASHLEREMQVSMQAGAIVGKLYDALLAQYLDPTNAESLRSLNVLCVRLVFCLYGEDAGIFGPHDMFHDYLARYDIMDMRNALVRLFKTLDTPLDERDPYLQDDLAAFPYVNGGLFGGDIEIPRFNEEIRDLLLHHASLDFDWSEISPTIFGAVFESTLNPETRRSGGMHYTSIENIHKVIDPLFLDDLRGELDNILAEKVPNKRRRRLLDYQERLASLTFLDPACGSGNFLTETYLSLRRLENRLIRSLYEGQAMFIGGEFQNPVRVSIHQFYGIEINDFAKTVATTALWISEAQMLAETERIVARDIDFLPLKTYPNIAEGNALRMDWRSLFNKTTESSEISEHSTCLPDYIMGNPPFVGARMMEQGGSQKKDIEDLFGKIKDVQDLDYVCGWYKKAAELMQGTHIKTGFVSTNSICQGSQVPILWNVLFNDFQLNIIFAYQTFKWNSEASEKAAVHCVIVGLSSDNPKQKTLFTSDGKAVTVSNISPYLTEGTSTFAVSQKEPLCNVPKMNFGNQPRDGGHFILTDDEKNEILSMEPTLDKWIRPYVGSEEFIKGKSRWCLWLRDASPMDIKQSKTLYERVNAVREFRLASKAKTTRGYAKVPLSFAQVTQPEGKDCLLIPRVSSERRDYVPVGFIRAGIVTSDAVQIVPDATLYHFGVITSCVHMAWMRTVCGRLEMRYRYSKEQVYNTFPWPHANDRQRERIEQTAQAILDARALYPDSSLADLYDPVTMPSELLKAHRDNDRAVMAAYGIPSTMSESEIVAHLFALYTELTR